MATTKTNECHQILTLSNMFHESKALFKLASPIALTALIFYTRSIVSMLFLGHTGDIELAAGSLAIAFANITGYSVLAGLALGMEPLCCQAFGANQVFPSSLGFVVSTRVGNELDSNRPGKARITAFVSIFLAGLMGLSALTFTTSLKNKWGRMFTNDSEILRLTSIALPVIGLCELGNCLQTIGCGVVRGIARPTTAANVNLGAFYIIGMPIAIGLVYGLQVGFVGLWLGLLSAQVCCAVLLLYVVGNINWEQEAKKAQMLTCNEFTIGETTSDSSECNHDNELPIRIVVT
ncbi:DETOXIFICATION 51-like protein [Tanacetum coccineum]